ncbi:MAG TPA: gluconate:H+ symporter [Thermoguttaceae bacterium]|nr:gluconate:H+ symporter [Thermoguttaceae bacterium]
MDYYPLIVLLIGLVTVIGMILVLRVNAFLALITAAILVSLLSPGEMADKIERVAEAFGSTVGKIGIVIAMAAIIGKCLMDSGAADRIVRAFLGVLGEKRAAAALMGSGFVLSVPVFFDTVFYLLVPLARSLFRRTNKNYVLYLTAIATGGAITHTLVPPTPGPLVMADTLGIDIGLMIMIGTMIGLPTAVVGLLICKVMNRMLELPMRPYAGEPEPEPLADDQLPGLWMSLMPVLLPVVMISANTVTKMFAEKSADPTLAKAAEVTALLGNPNLALLLSAVIAMYVLVRQRGLTLKQLAKTTEVALMSGGVIILITAGGGAFGAMLRQSGVKEAIEGLVGTEGQNVGMLMLLLAFGIATVMKIAQGSGTVSMITTSSIMASMGVSSAMLGCNVVYLATAIGAGSLTGSWMNDSGFWIFARMGNLTEVEALKTWTILLALLGVTALGFTLLAARFLPLL